MYAPLLAYACSSRALCDIDLRNLRNEEAVNVSKCLQVIGDRIEYLRFYMTGLSLPKHLLTSKRANILSLRSMGPRYPS
jgi:hypothetical protein